MAVQGKKINELTAIGTVSNETVLPAVYVSGTTVNSTANKISIEQISTKVQDDMSTALAGKQDTLVSGTNIKTINNESLLGNGNLDIGSYILPKATTETLGGVKIGEGLSVTADGTMSTKVGPHYKISTFNNSNYITLPIFDFASAEKWSIVGHFKTASSLNTQQAFLGPSTQVFPTIRIDLRDTGKMWFIIDQSQGVGERIESPVLEPDTEYWFKFEYAGNSVYNLYFGTTKENMEFIGSTTSNVTLTSSNYNLGRLTFYGTGNYWQGSVFINDFKVYIDDKIFFDGVNIVPSNQYKLNGSILLEPVN